MDFRRLSEISRGGIANRTRVEWPNFTVEWREKERGGGAGVILTAEETLIAVSGDRGFASSGKSRDQNAKRKRK